MLLSSLCQYWLPLVVGHSYLPKYTVIFMYFLPVFQIPCYVTQAFSRQKKGPLILGTHSPSLKKGKEENAYISEMQISIHIRIFLLSVRKNARLK